MSRINNILSQIQEKANERQKSFAVLIDPDKVTEEKLLNIASLSMANEVDFFFVGGSLLMKDKMQEVVSMLKENTNIPVILFPSNAQQICNDADAILFLSLISGRNPDLLIGQQVIAAPLLKASNLEVLPTGYMLIDSGKQTTASYMSVTTPIPADKPEIAMATALAGEYLGLKMLYMDGGSGAQNVAHAQTISLVKKNVTIPLIVGGGICTKEDAQKTFEAGADVIVIGNQIEKDPSIIAEVAKCKTELNLV